MARNIITMESPIELINNDDLFYDIKTHRYILTIKGIKSQTGDDIVLSEGDNNKAKVELNTLSRLVYNYMYSKIDRADIEVVEFRISRDVTLALALQEAMGSFYEADIINGATWVYFRNGLDEGLNIEDIQAAKVPPIIHDILDNAKLLKSKYGFKIPDDIYRTGY